MRHLFLLLTLSCLLFANVASAQVTKLIVNSPPGEAIGGGKTYTLTPADGYVFGATSNEYGGVTVSIHNADYSTWWQIFFAAANDEPLMTGEYKDCVRYPQLFDNSRNQLQASSSNSPSCTDLSGKFTVKGLTWIPNFIVESFWVTLEQSCQGEPPLKVEIMYNMPLATPANTTSWGRLKTIYR